MNESTEGLHLQLYRIVRLFHFYRCYCTCVNSMHRLDVRMIRIRARARGWIHCSPAGFDTQWEVVFPCLLQTWSIKSRQDATPACPRLWVLAPPQLKFNLSQPRVFNPLFVLNCRKHEEVSEGNVRMPVKPVTFSGSDSVFGAKPQRKKRTMNNVFFPSTRTP